MIASDEAKCAFAVVHVLHERVGFGYGGVGVVVERRVFDQLAERPLTGLYVVEHLVSAVDGAVDLVVHLVARKQFADATLAVLDLVGNQLQFVESGVSVVEERGIVDDLADGALPALDGADDGIETLQQNVDVVYRCLGGADDVLDAGLILAGKGTVVGCGFAMLVGAVDIHEGVAEHARGL